MRWLNSSNQGGLPPPFLLVALMICLSLEYVLKAYPPVALATKVAAIGTQLANTGDSNPSLA